MNGSNLSDQEIRNVILLMENAKAQHWIEKLAQYSSFKETTPISEKQESEAFNLELLIRYFSLRNLEKHKTILEKNRDIDPYLDEMASNMFSGFNFTAEETLFENVFSMFDKVLGSNAFKKFNREKNRYTGAISLPIYELFTYHLSKKLEADPHFYDDPGSEPLLERISQQLEDNSIYKAVISQSRGIDRMATITSMLDGNLFT